MANEYSAGAALEMLLRKLDEREPSLAADIRSAINAGRDIVEQSESGRKRKRAREYRKTVAFADGEALAVAVRVLRAHFVEQAMFAASATRNFAPAAIGAPAQEAANVRLRQMDTERVPKPGDEKILEIELRTETQLTKSERETIPVPFVSVEAIQEARERLKRLVELTTFSERNLI